MEHVAGCTKLKPHGVLNFFSYFFSEQQDGASLDVWGTALHSPPMGTQGGGPTAPFPPAYQAPHLRLFKRAVNARAVNTESFGDLSSTPMPCAFIWRTCAASIEAVLCRRPRP
jgi:hypothetical protein